MNQKEKPLLPAAFPQSALLTKLNITLTAKEKCLKLNSNMAEQS